MESKVGLLGMLSSPKSDEHQDIGRMPPNVMDAWHLVTLKGGERG